MHLGMKVPNKTTGFIALEMVIQLLQDDCAWHSVQLHVALGTLLYIFATCCIQNSSEMR